MSDDITQDRHRAEAGPANGRPVMLLHGWPYDIHSFVDVAPLLAEAHYRVIVPYLRGYFVGSYRHHFCPPG
jgi:pimeloyl-ACP methyl ester carboxylesterase